MSWENTYLQFKSKSNLDSIAANQMRQASFENFLSQGLPTRKEEAWKYTSLTDFKAVPWQSALLEEEILTHDQLLAISKNLPAEFYNLVFVNGSLNQTLSDDLDSDITLSEIVAEDLVKDDKHVESYMLQLSKSFLSKKLIINIKSHKTFAKPLQIVVVQSSKASVYVSEKISIKVGEDAELTLIVNTFSFANATGDALNMNVDVSVANSARVKMIQLQNEDVQSYHFSQCEVNLASNAQFQSLAMSLGSKLTRNYLHVNFLGKNSFAGVYGLTILDSKQHVDNYTFIQHSIGENQSIQHYKSILSGASQSVFRGRVRIEQDAQKANSEQLNNNLLLTREASANSIPQLEIYADDVKAGHGSTMGQLNKDEIFYFLSRGINQFEAVKMLAFGYAKELVYKFEDQSVQDFLMKSLHSKLERMIQNV
ncbi:MAG: SufD family Fe-S cluster assembly protein [Bdellovibrio sp.]|nr:SufD family Fe-S cluster assembly protein [Bdellovibrio sp.]